MLFTWQEKKRNERNIITFSLVVIILFAAMVVGYIGREIGNAITNNSDAVDFWTLTISFVAAALWGIYKLRHMPYITQYIKP